MCVSKSLEKSLSDRFQAGELLAACSLFDALSPLERSQLLDGSLIAAAERGEPLWISGSPARFMAIIGEGIVRMTRRSPRDVEIAVEVVGPGDCAGLLACVAEGPYPLSAYAVTNVAYLRIPNSEVMRIYDENSDVKDQFVHTLAPALLDAFDFMACMVSGNVEQRLAIALDRVADLLAPKEPGAPLPITKQNLADIAGTTVESAIRTTSRWLRLGLISSRPRELRLLDRSALEKIVRG